MPDNPRAAARRTWLITALLATIVGFSVAPILNGSMNRGNKDYSLWYYVGRAVAEGREIYPQDGRVFPFMYPPSCSALFALASAGGEMPFIALLVAVNSVAWVASILLSVYLATGRLGWERPLIYLVPSLGVVAYIHDTYLLGQPNLVLLASMLGAIVLLQERREAVAGGLVAFATAVKAFPFLAIGYLVYRRFWKASLAMVAALVLAVLVAPMPFRGVAGAYRDAGTWVVGMVFRYDSGGIAQRPERGFSFKNQSLMALANRLLRDIPADGEAGDGWKVNLASLDFPTVNRLILLSAALLGTLYISLMPRRDNRTRLTTAIEGALLLLLILMYSPLSFNYFFVWLLYPLTLALHLGLEAPRRSAGRRVLLGSVAMALGLLALSIFSRRWVAAYGNSFFAAFVLLVGLGWRLGVEPGAESPLQWAMGRLRRGSRRTRGIPAPHLGRSKSAVRRSG
jgi:hypothetical protein